jgi:hypothetical protein
MFNQRLQSSLINPGLYELKLMLRESLRSIYDLAEVITKVLHQMVKAEHIDLARVNRIYGFFEMGESALEFLYQKCLVLRQLRKLIFDPFPELHFRLLQAQCISLHMFQQMCDDTTDTVRILQFLRPNHPIFQLLEALRQLWEVLAHHSVLGDHDKLKQGVVHHIMNHLRSNCFVE